MTETTIRNLGLRQILRERRDALQDDVQNRIRGGRSDRPIEGGDLLEHSDDDVRSSIEFALLQMRAETLVRIDEALVRLEMGKYGFCVGCEGEISERRLRALPFAVRCQKCEERREEAQKQAGRRGAQRGGLSLFPHMASS
jgi:DnaK suppressor protein